MKKAPTSTSTKPVSTTGAKTTTTGAKTTTTGIKPASTTATKTSTTTGTKQVSTVKPAASNATKTTSTHSTKSTTTASTKNNASQAVHKPAEKPAPQMVEKAPEVKKMHVEQIKLTQLFNKIEEYRDKNRSLLIIDKLEANDSFTFFKYKGYIADISEYSIKEQTNTQTRDKSIEQARKQTVIALRGGGNLVFFVDKMTLDLQDFFKGASFFSPEQLFVPEESQKDSYYAKKLITQEENVDGFGNKGGYYPNKDFAALILSKSDDLEPDDLMKKLNMPADLFDCIVIS